MTNSVYRERERDCGGNLFPPVSQHLLRSVPSWSVQWATRSAAARYHQILLLFMTHLLSSKSEGFEVFKDKVTLLEQMLEQYQIFYVYELQRV